MSDSNCQSSSCNCGPTRRDFIKLAGAAGLGLMVSRMPVMAGPFDQQDWDQLIPADKKLHPDWVKSLFAHGTPQTYTKSRNELKYIGMPVGGICAGSLYLSGDGRLWNWDIFNQKFQGALPISLRWEDVGLDFAGRNGTFGCRDGARYVKPAVYEDSQDIKQGFAIRVESNGQVQTRPLDASGWAEVSFTGQYPIGTVEYSDPASPVSVKLEAFSPFIPHNADDSGLPATVLHFTVTNRGSASAKVNLAGWLQNATSFYSAKPGEGQRVNTVSRGSNSTLVAMAFEKDPVVKVDTRPDILVEDFEKGYNGWKTEGTAFGTQPVSRAVIPPYQGDLGGKGGKVVNSHSSAPGNTPQEKDNETGKLTSPPFKIQRKFLTFYIGGGRRADLGVRLFVDGNVVHTVAGHDSNQMRRESFNVAAFEGREAVIEVFDNAKGGWANVGVDHFVQTDTPKADIQIDAKTDFGTMALAIVGGDRGIFARPDVAAVALSGGIFEDSKSETTASGLKPIGSVGRELTIAPGESAEVHFVLAWNFPKTTISCPDANTGNYYAKRFTDATAVASYVAGEMPRLESLTRLWRDTWYDSTLPYWFLDRTFANTSTLATSTSHRFGSGRFWGWEGVGCCEGTCTHVWHYAQAMGRIFPELERDLRERVDFGVGFDASQGVVRHRAEGTGPAIDGQCGRILCVLREHQMSNDSAFLKRIWPKIKQAAEYVIRHDKDDDGVIDGAQRNTLDAAWYGQIAWITSLSIAALRATEEMAKEMGDTVFAERCRKQADKARAMVETRLYNSEYFFQIPDPKREKSLGTYEACHIDQVHGQSWAWQVGLGRVLDREKTLSALQALWKYNFTPDVGPFRKKYTTGRPYAMAGDGGLIMSSNPKMLKDVYGISSWQIGYFNECMSGFEHQVASHMMAEGMTLESLAITRAIHDRYHASKRNPYNEVECSDHYARAMASYGTLLAACGFTSHGPSGQIGFAPKLTPEDFKCAFTAADGWGSFAQTISGGIMSADLSLHWGSLTLKTISLEMAAVKSVHVTLGKTTLPARFTLENGRLLVTLQQQVELAAGDKLEITTS